MAKIHAEQVSIPALAYQSVIEQIEPQNSISQDAKDRLINWDCQMEAQKVEPTIYSAMRDALLKEILETATKQLPTETNKKRQIRLQKNRKKIKIIKVTKMKTLLKKMNSILL